MKKILFFILFSIVFLTHTIIVNFKNTVVIHANIAENYDYIADEILITITEEESKKWIEYNVLSFSEIECLNVEDLTSYYNPTLEDNIYPSTNIAKFQRILKIKLKKSGTESISSAINSLLQREDVDYAAPNYYIETELHNNIEVNNINTYNIARSQTISQWGNDAINLDEAADYIEDYTKNNVLVGVVDWGVEEHIDIKYVISDLSCDCTVSNGGNPFIDSFNGHGTMIAGIIAGLNINGNGISGVSQNAYIVSLKHNAQFDTSNNTILSISSIIEAVSKAGGKNIRIINLSFGFPIFDQNLLIAIRNFPGLAVCAAGNSGDDLDSNKIYPACFDLDNIISVGALNESLTYCDFSNYGMNEVDIFAPGENIWSTSLNDSYKSDSGTSFAAPFVAGVASLLISIEHHTGYEFFDAKFIKKLLIDSATKVSSLATKCVSGGYLNAENALIEAFNFQATYETAGSVYHTVMPKYAYSYLEEHEWGLLINSYGLIRVVNPPILGGVCVKCGTSRV